MHLRFQRVLVLNLMQTDLQACLTFWQTPLLRRLALLESALRNCLALMSAAIAAPTSRATLALSRLRSRWVHLRFFAWTSTATPLQKVNNIATQHTLPNVQCRTRLPFFCKDLQSQLARRLRLRHPP